MFSYIETILTKNSQESVIDEFLKLLFKKNNFLLGKKCFEKENPFKFF